MEQFHNVYIIGSSHISKESIAEIRGAFTNLKPDIVAVELDKRRAYVLMSGQEGKMSLSMIKSIGLKGYLFALIGSWASKKLGKLVGVKPGTEMKTAILLANENKCTLELIDRDIEITLKRFSKYFTWKEKWHVFVDLFNGIILRKKEPMLNFDLNKVPKKDLINMLIGRVKLRYPGIYKAIIEERNYYMARKLKKIMSDNPDKKILAVMGAGHVDGILSILKENEGVGISYKIIVNQ